MLRMVLGDDGFDDGGQVVWAGPGLLATASGESVVRMWDVANEVRG